MDLIRGQMGEKEETRGDLYGVLSDRFLFFVGFSSRRRRGLKVKDGLDGTAVDSERCSLTSSFRSCIGGRRRRVGAALEGMIMADVCEAGRGG